MGDTVINRILDNIINVPPVFAKKMLKPDIAVPEHHITRLHFAVIEILSNEGKIPVSELAKTLFISKPQMTRLADQLVKGGLIERQPGERDRRVIYLAITPRGVWIREKMKQIVMARIKQKLTALTPAELQEMADALDILRNLSNKL